MKSNNVNALESDIIALSRKDHDAICAASYKHPLGFLIRFLMYTGITMAELLVLSWCDIDLQTNRLYIPQLLIPTNNYYLKHPEVQSRYVPLLPFLREELLEWEFVQKSFCKPYVITAETGAAFATTLTGEPLYPEYLENVFNDVLAMCGLPPVPIRALRDTYAVFVLGCGLNPYSFNEIMGDINAADYYGNYLKTINNAARPVDNIMQGRW